MELDRKPSWLPVVKLHFLTLSTASMVEEVLAIFTRADVRLSPQYRVWFAEKKSRKKSRKKVAKKVAKKVKKYGVVVWHFMGSVQMILSINCTRNAGVVYQLYWSQNLQL